jgi:hypothetical protein
MQIVRDALAGLGCFLGILFACDLLLTLHGIRNELRASREAREAEHVPQQLF